MHRENGVEVVNENKEMAADVRETRDAVLRIEGRLKSGDERMGRIEKNQEKHEHALFGNGKPGLVEVVGDLRKRAMFWRKLGWIALGAIAPLAGGLAWFWLTQGFKHGPGP